MSCAHYRWAWSQTLTSSRLLVLLNLTERASEAGECYPSIARISQDTHLNRKTIIGALADLEAAGLIRKNRQAGTSTRYQLNLQSAALAVPKTELVAVTQPVPETAPSRSKNGTGAHPKNGTQNPPLNPSITLHEGVSGITPADQPTIPQKSISARPRKRSRPQDFAVSDAVRRWAEDKGYADLEAHFENFCEKADARGYQYVDWDAAFKTAIREDWANLRQTRASLNPHRSPTHAAHQSPFSAVERCRQSAEAWAREREPAVIIDFDDYRTV